MNSWKNYGIWKNQLLDRRDNLPVETINTIKQLTNGLSTKKEKVKKVYEFVQSKTRYVSVQLGIGGWQPFTAEIVDKYGYGDCKGQ